MSFPVDRASNSCSLGHRHNGFDPDGDMDNMSPSRMPPEGSDVEDDPDDPPADDYRAENEAGDFDDHEEPAEEDPDILFELGPATLDDLRMLREFIKALRNAKLDESGLSEVGLERLRDPSHEVASINDPVLGRSLEILLGLDTAANSHYKDVRKANTSWDPPVEMLSLAQVQKKAEEISGVVPMYTDMCTNSCMAYAGPYANLDRCPTCGEAYYDPEKTTLTAQKRMVTLPVGPQIQAAWCSPSSAEAMKYRQRATQVILATVGEDKEFDILAYSDIIHSTEYLKACLQGKIKDDDTVLMHSTDGVQLYRMKQSDCWLYIWVLLDIAPDTRYKNEHIFVGAVIPGPKHPKDMESFLFPGFHHVSALMQEGLKIWNASADCEFVSRIFIPWFTADTPGMTPISGFVGHTGKHGCRLYCEVPGRHKHGAGGHYYPAAKKPAGNYNLQGFLHDDVDIVAAGQAPSTQWT